MVTGELKSQVDKIWETFWTGGISNPLTVIEQFTFLLFLRRLDEKQLLEEKKANFIGENQIGKNPISGKISNLTYQPQHAPFRWHTFKHNDPETMFNLFTRPSVDALTVFEHMKSLGRCAVIVPDGVLFGSSNAHKNLRQTLVEGQKLEAVISMPSGVFKPYAGVSTAILIFTKTNNGGTDNVWFYDMQADGYSLDDKRAAIKENNIPDIIQRFKQRDAECERKRTEQSFLVPFDEIKGNDWDLSINRYKEIIYEEVAYDPPHKIIEQIEQLDTQRAEALSVLKGLLT